MKSAQRNRRPVSLRYETIRLEGALLLSDVLEKAAHGEASHQLDAYYARLHSRTREDLRYVLDPQSVMGEDYPSETFRVLNSN